MEYSISKNGIDFIKSFESFSSESYKCAAGFLTIGYGHVIRSYESYSKISEEEAEELLKLDLAIAEKSVMRNIKTLISQKQFDALVSFTFNIGTAALQRSTLRQKINYGADLEEIYYEFIRWVYANGQKITGLLKRRIAEADLYISS